MSSFKKKKASFYKKTNNLHSRSMSCTIPLTFHAVNARYTCKYTCLVSCFFAMSIRIRSVRTALFPLIFHTLNASFSFSLLFFFLVQKFVLHSSNCSSCALYAMASDWDFHISNCRIDCIQKRCQVSTSFSTDLPHCKIML